MNKKLSREKVLKMPAGRNMDVLVAKIILEINVITDTNNFRFYFENNGQYPGKAPFFDVPKYSTDISAAWDIVQKMCKKHFRYEVGGNFMGLDHKYAAFDNEQWADKNPLFKAFAETTPLAICRAALLAVMEEE